MAAQAVNLEKIIILIPSLDPDEKLLEMLKSLRERGFSHIVCVDDGSSGPHGGIFRKAEEAGAIVLTHCINLGKGRALKTGINYIGKAFPEALGIVTADGDGQHGIEDIVSCAEALIANPDSLIFGCRDFDKEGIPAKSRFGNVLTRRLMAFLCGIKLSDTQTGLRGLPMSRLEFFLRLPGERYEYEMSMIIEAHVRGIAFVEVPIAVIYIDGNEGSHFHPIRDSFQIYKKFLKFLFSSLSSFVVDIILFSLFLWIFSHTPLTQGDMHIMAATVSARVLSAMYNFFMNKSAVFRSDASLPVAAAKYATLAVLQMLLSGYLVILLHHILWGNATLSKLIVDTCLFVISYQIQQRWVFVRKA